MVWGHTPAVFVPLSMEQVLSPEWKYLADHKSYWIAVAGRLRPGVTRAEAEASLNPLFRALRTEEFKQLTDQSAKARQDFVGATYLHVDAGAKGFSPMRGDVQAPLTIIFGMVRGR